MANKSISREAIITGMINPFITRISANWTLLGILTIFNDFLDAKTSKIKKYIYQRQRLELALMESKCLLYANVHSQSLEVSFGLCGDTIYMCLVLRRLHCLCMIICVENCVRPNVIYDYQRVFSFNLSVVNYFACFRNAVYKDSLINWRIIH